MALLSPAVLARLLGNADLSGFATTDPTGGKPWLHSSGALVVGASGPAPASHTHAYGSLTGLPTLGSASAAAVGDFATAVHSHVIGDTTGLQAALDAKQADLGYTPVNQAGDTMTGLLTTPTLSVDGTLGVNAVRLLVKGAVGQTSSLQEWRDSAGTILGFVQANGAITNTSGFSTTTGSFRAGTGTFVESGGTVMFRNTANVSSPCYFGNSSSLNPGNIFFQQAGDNRFVLGTNSRAVLGPGNQSPSQSYGFHLNGANSGYGNLLITGIAAQTAPYILAQTSAAATEFSVSPGGRVRSNNAVVANTGGAGGPSFEMLYSGYGIGVNSNGETVVIINNTGRVRIGFGVTVNSAAGFQFSSTADVGLMAGADTSLRRVSAGVVGVYADGSGTTPGALQAGSVTAEATSAGSVFPLVTSNSNNGAASGTGVAFRSLLSTGTPTFIGSIDIRKTAVDVSAATSDFVLGLCNNASGPSEVMRVTGAGILTARSAILKPATGDPYLRLQNYLAGDRVVLTATDPGLLKVTSDGTTLCSVLATSLANGTTGLTTLGNATGGVQIGTTTTFKNTAYPNAFVKIRQTDSSAIFPSSTAAMGVSFAQYNTGTEELGISVNNSNVAYIQARLGGRIAFGYGVDMSTATGATRKVRTLADGGLDVLNLTGSAQAPILASSIANGTTGVTTVGNATGGVTSPGNIYVATGMNVGFDAASCFRFQASGISVFGAFTNPVRSSAGHWALGYHANLGASGAPMVVGGHLGLAATSGSGAGVDTRIARTGVGTAAIIANSSYSLNTPLGTFQAKTIEAVNITFQTAASDPTGAELIAGASAVWKNSTSGIVRTFANDGGVIKKSLPLTSTATSTGWAVSNYTVRKTFDPTVDSLGDFMDFVCTAVAHHIDLGIVSA